ncbi:hypothetical protein [Streptomyces sp. CAU 1734]|uniref:hypothetical protein n=1 Tax=Streptomyces sp. CAU 1734 TaxID=3140360 RepID=UPI0032612C32
MQSIEKITRVAAELTDATTRTHLIREAAERLAPQDFSPEDGSGPAGDAERALAGWAVLHNHRDVLVQAALAAGVSRTRIQEITRISRSTIDRHHQPLPHRLTMRSPAEDFALRTAATDDGDKAVYELRDRRTGQTVWGHAFAISDRKGVAYHYGNAVAATHSVEEVWDTDRLQQTIEQRLGFEHDDCRVCGKEIRHHHSPMILRVAYDDHLPGRPRVREHLVIGCFEDETP